MHISSPVGRRKVFLFSISLQSTLINRIAFLQPATGGRTRSRARWRVWRRADRSSISRRRIPPRPASCIHRTCWRRSLTRPGSPAAFGLHDARAAVAETYTRQRGLEISADQVVLTASTSEAYSLLFKLLCDAGSRVLPSYPLFDHLTALDAVDQARYQLDSHGNWTMNIHSLDARRGTTGRGVSGHGSPTIRPDPIRPDGSSQLVAGRDAAIILDEVFWDYSLSGPLPEPAPFHRRR